MSTIPEAHDEVQEEVREEQYYQWPDLEELCAIGEMFAGIASEVRGNYPEFDDVGAREAVMRVLLDWNDGENDYDEDMESLIPDTYGMHTPSGDKAVRTALIAILTPLPVSVIWRAEGSYEA